MFSRSVGKLGVDLGGSQNYQLQKKIYIWHCPHSYHVHYLMSYLSYHYAHQGLKQDWQSLAQNSKHCWFISMTQDRKTRKE